MKRVQTNTLRNLSWFAAQQEPVTWAEVAHEFRQLPQTIQNLLKRYTAHGLLLCEARPVPIVSQCTSHLGNEYECSRTVPIRHYAITPAGLQLLAERSPGRDLTPPAKRVKVVANSVFNYAASL